MDISTENEGKIYVAAGDLEVSHHKPDTIIPTPQQNYYYGAPPDASPPAHHASTIHYNPVPPPPPPKDVEETKRIMGLRRPTFWLIVVLVLVVIIAAVGGGVGGSLAVEKARQDAIAQQAGTSSLSAGGTTSPSSTSRAPQAGTTAASSQGSAPTIGTVNGAIVVPTVGILPLECPGLTGSQQTVTYKEKSWTYRLSCGTDYAANDTVALVMYTLTDCLKACSSYNMNLDLFRPGTKKCLGVTFNKNLENSVRVDFGTCWLKDTVADPKSRSQTDLVGAQLVDESG
ncbi:hypothetical protein OQA88_5776 [Cercophora sp. LCS_1]